MDFNYSNFIDDELLDETDQIKSIAKQTWLSTASTSLANLEKVQTNVYNVGLLDPRELKATNLRSRRKGQLGSQAELETDRSSIQSGTLKAWGSNSSIPDSIHQHGRNTLQKLTRPASAKVNNNRVLPPSGRKPRPQSAKEPLPNGTVSEHAFGVKGAKYDPSGRPPKGVSKTSSMGWVGPPAGLKYPDRPPNGVAWQMDFPVEDEIVKADLKSANYEDAIPEAPSAPHASPVPPSPELEERTKTVFELFIGDPYKVNEDADMFDSSDDDDILDLPSPRDYTKPPVNHIDEHTHEYVNHLESQAPEKESLRISLPTADDDYDEADDVDTERLLAEAESVSKKFDLKSIISTNKNIPLSPLETDFTHDSDLINEKADVTEKTQSSSGVEISNKKKAEELESGIFTENGLQFENTDKGNKNSMLERDKSAVKFSEDVTTVNITPRNIGRKVEELHYNKKKTTHHTNDNFVDLIEIKNRVEPVLSTSKAEFIQKEIKSPPRGATRPPSAKSMATRSAKQNENSSRRNTSHVSAVRAKNEPSLTSCNRTHSSQSRPRSASEPLNRVAKPITMVTVDYGEAEKSENEKSKKETKKMKERKRKDDIETVMEKIGVEEFEDEENVDTTKNKELNEMRDAAEGEALIDSMSAPTVCKSEQEKNYYEISRHSSMSNVAEKVERQDRLELDGNLSKENTVYKTTKTLEFHEIKPKEVTIKSIIDPHMVSTKEKERFLATSPDIKHRKPPSRPSSAKHPVTKKTVISDDLERPGSRLGFVAMAPDQAADKEEIKTKVVNRPASTPVYRRPRSAVKDKENKTQNKTKMSEDIQKELSEKVKEDRDKVIDNLLERTKSLVDNKEELSEGTENALPEKPSVERKKARPLSAHTSPLARLKETTVKTTSSRRPTSAVTPVHRHYASYSRTSNVTSVKQRKSSTKPRVVLTEPCVINTNTSYYEEETEEDVTCQQMEQDLAEKGVHISAATLQRALYPPSGKSRYYQITANLPKKSSLSFTYRYRVAQFMNKTINYRLLSHPKVWLPEEHKRLQKAEKTLEKANEMMYLQEKAEKRRAYLAALSPEQRKKLKKKGKKGGKKLRKSQSSLR